MAVLPPLPVAIAGPTHEARLLRLTTPLGPDVLLAECVRGEETLDDGFSFSIGALAPDANIQLKALIGQPALLELMTAHSRADLRPFHGHITAVEHCGADGGLARYRITLEPWTRFAALGRDSRVFQDVTVFDILDTVLGGYAGKGTLVPQWRFEIADRAIYPVRSLVTQYQESDFAFVQRLMAEEGLFHWFEHAGDPASPALGSHTLVIADHNGAFQPNAQQRIRFTQSSTVMREDGLDRWRAELRERTGAVELGSWDYRALQNRPVSAAGAAGNGAALTDRDTPGAYGYVSREHGERMAVRRMEALTARREIYVGAGTVRTLAPATTFALEGEARADAAGSGDSRTFLVVRTVHLMHNNLSADEKAGIAARLAPSALAKMIDAETAGSLHAVGTGKGERPLYRNRIDAIRAATPYRMDGTGRFRRPVVNGQQTAIVVGPAGSVIHTDRDHRIKVQFHWQRGAQAHSRLEHPAADGHTGAPADDTAGTWVRVATPLAPVAGDNWGGNALPRVGQEVLVDFIEGNIDRPVVIGAVYNGRGQADAQHNQNGAGAGTSTGNAPSWFPGEGGGHAHGAVLSGLKTQALASSQAGAGAYSQLVLDDTPGQSRLGLQRHAAAHEGTDELNLGSLRHQTDNQRLLPAGFGAELKSAASVALRAGQGMLLTADARNGASGAQLDVREGASQIARSRELQQTLAGTAQQHNAKLAGEGEPDKLPAIVHMADTIAVVGGTDGTESVDGAGGAGTVPAFTRPHLQLSAAAGMAAVTPASALVAAGKSTSLAAGEDINFASQANTAHLALKGVSLFSYGKAGNAEKPNTETGIRLHAASGKVSSQSQSGTTSLTADKAITVASVTKSVTVAAPQQHVMLTAQGAFLKLEGGNIMLHGPGTIAFKASQKELAGPASATRSVTLPAPGEPKVCELRAAGAAAAGDSVVPLV